MVRIEIRTKFNNIPRIAASIRPIVSQVVRKTTFDVEADIKTEMRGPKHGRMYRGHQASAPGESPAVDTSLLINSIHTEHPTDLTSTIGTNAKYAMALEYGSRRMAPRPVWRPTIDKRRKPFIDALIAVLSRLK